MKIFVLAVVVVGRTAFAQPSDTPRAHKRLLTAVIVSDVAVGVPMLVAGIGAEATHGSANAAFGVIAVTALLLGPSAGHWYVGEYVTKGMVVRLAGVAAIAALAIGDPHVDPTVTIIALMGAAGLWTTGVLIDAATLPGAVQRFNDQHALGVAPLVTPEGIVPGVSIGGAF